MISGVLLGSVAEAIVRHAPCPVLVVPQRRAATQAAA
jgi:nucleotide-binding universal stress UspA family protein